MNGERKKILIVDDDPGIREVLTAIFEGHQYEVERAENGRDALQKVRKSFFDHIVTDLSMPLMGGLEFLENLQKLGVESIITVISAHAELSNVSKAFKLGACDFIAKPFGSDEEILLTIRQAEEKKRLQKDNIRLQQEVEDKYIFSNIVARSKVMSATFSTIMKIADYKTTVLITGESGTGKELIARAIHYNGIRKKAPLIDVNCGGIPENLLESELFGYVKGAFTDATRTKKGLFEEADGGTLFLDEIGDMPLPLQVKILRVLQEEEIRPLGQGQSTKVDVRIIAATAKDLRKEVGAGRFREDLFYRINVLALEIPPLRRRKEDIPLLVDFFIKKYNERLGLEIKGVDGPCLKKLMDYRWPGNVRELENVIERSMALTDNEILTVSDLSDDIRKLPAIAADDAVEEGLSIKKNRIIMEKRLITRALAEAEGNRTKAAAMLEMSIPALLYKIKEYQVEGK